MDRRVIATLDGAILASIPVGALRGWRRLTGEQLVEAAKLEMVELGLLSPQEALMVRVEIRDARRPNKDLDTRQTAR